MTQMLNGFSGWLTSFLAALPGILLALTLHEWAHGKMADYLGDPTPALQGRLTVNPLPHIDWVGFAMIALFNFGWAKPVQVNPNQFKKTGVKKGMMMVSLAGPGMNLLLAGLGAILFHVLYPARDHLWIIWLLGIVYYLVYINVILAIFNLIPVPPLDGSKILAGLLPDSGARAIYSLEPYGMVILLLLIMTNITGKIILPAVSALMKVLIG